MKYIQFIGTQRSGSNLLRIMLNQLPEISAPHPPHILKTFGPLIPEYGDLQNPQNFESLVNDVCTWVELNPVKWQLSRFNRSSIIDRCKERTLIRLHYEIYSAYTELHKSEYACCKSMSNVHLHQDLETAGILPYYIYLHRDGRDVACSFKKALVGEKHVYHIAKQWKADQEEALKVEKSVPIDRFIEVNYKDLITNPIHVLKRICRFLKVQFNENMLKYYNAEESMNTSSSGDMWKNVSRPIMTGNYNKYLKYLSREEIEIFEYVAGDTLQKLGYALSSQHFLQPRTKKLAIDDYSAQNALLKQDVILKAARHDIDVRYPQQQFLSKLKSDFAKKKYLRRPAVAAEHPRKIYA